jgi:CspA family cold shock protein
MNCNALPAAVVAALVGSAVLAGCGGTSEPPTAAAPSKSSAVSGQHADKGMRSALSAQRGRSGTVKVWNATKGFGFIKDAETGNEIFVHITGLRAPLKTLEPGQAVRYLGRPGRKTIDAIDVTLVGSFVAKSGQRGG